MFNPYHMKVFCSANIIIYVLTCELTQCNKPWA